MASKKELNNYKAGIKSHLNERFNTITESILKFIPVEIYDEHLKSGIEKTKKEYLENMLASIQLIKDDINPEIFLQLLSVTDSKVSHYTELLEVKLKEAYQLDYEKDLEYYTKNYDDSIEKPSGNVLDITLKQMLKIHLSFMAATHDMEELLIKDGEKTLSQRILGEAKDYRKDIMQELKEERTNKNGSLSKQDLAEIEEIVNGKTMEYIATFEADLVAETKEEHIKMMAGYLGEYENELLSLEDIRSILKPKQTDGLHKELSTNAYRKAANDCIRDNISVTSSVAASEDEDIITYNPAYKKK